MIQASRLNSASCVQVLPPQAAARDVVGNEILGAGVDARVAGGRRVERRVAEAATGWRREHLQPVRLPEHQHAGGAQERHRDLDIPGADPGRFQEPYLRGEQATPADRGVRR